MRILIPSIQVPFVKGGALMMTAGLKEALIKKGHQVEIVTIAFKFSPESYIKELIEFLKQQDFNNFNGYHIDKVIVLQFPVYYIQHKDKVLWLMHQHRAVYELYDEHNSTKELTKLRKIIYKNDNEQLSKIKHRFSMCQNISNRLKRYNHIDAKFVYHPPANEDRFYCEQSYGYIFLPSRLESLKRQDLLIEAMQYTTSKVIAIIAGEGGLFDYYQDMVDDMKLKDKVTLIGSFSEEEKYTYYARSLAVFFAPFDEDYGYITLEAMLSSKAVITCKDSGGTLEFVIDKKTGFILEPEPKEIAKKLDWLYNNQKKAKRLGENAFKSYKNKDISWDNVVDKILEH